MNQDIYTGKKILLTGASSGIGLEFAKILSGYDCKLIIVSSRRQVLEEIKEDLQRAGKAKVFSYAADLSDLGAVEKMCGYFVDNNLAPDILINDAAKVSYGYYHKLDWESEYKQIILNSITPIYLIRKFLPEMIKNNFGKILNVGSVAGNMPSPFFSTYNSTKAFINSFSQALSGELYGTNVQCATLLPGKTNSPRFFNQPYLKERTGDSSNFASPHEVAKYGLKLLERGKDYGVYGTRNKITQFIKRFVPRKILQHVLRKHCYSELLEDNQNLIYNKKNRSQFYRNLRQIKAGSYIVYTLLKFKFLKKPTPVCVTFQITKYCNLKCFYCYANAEKFKDLPDFTYEDYTRLIDEAYNLGCRWVRFLGGEPLTREDIGKMIDYAYNKGILTEMNTNGYFVKQKAQQIKNLDSLVISIDGARETNDKCRGQGAYDKCLEAIEVAKDLGIPIRLHGCFTKYHTQADIDHLAELAVKYGAAFNFSAPSPVIWADDKRMYGHPSQQQVAMLHQRCAELKDQGYPVTTTRIGAEYVKKWPKPDSDVITKDDLKNLNFPKKSYIPCLDGKLCAEIDVDGMVYPCAGHWRGGINAKEVGLEKAWENNFNLHCVQCNYLSNIEQSLLFHLNSKTLIEVVSYMFGRTKKNN